MGANRRYGTVTERLTCPLKACHVGIDLEGYDADECRAEAVCNPLSPLDGEARELHELGIEVLEQNDGEKPMSMADDGHIVTEEGMGGAGQLVAWRWQAVGMAWHAANMSKMIVSTKRR